MNRNIFLSLLSIAFFLPPPLLFSQDKAVLDISTFNKDIRPQDDLFQYVNGTWLKETEIPGDKTNYGAFTVLADLSEKRLKDIVNELSEGEFKKGSDEQKVSDFYRAFMDEEKIEALGCTPIEGLLKKVDEAEDTEKLIYTQAELSVSGIMSTISAGVSIDAKDSTKYITYLYQSGLTLPDRDYYLIPDKEGNSESIAAFKAYICEMMELAGQECSSQTADRIIAFETRLADAQWDNTTLRDVHKRYNKYSVGEATDDQPALHQMNEVFDWEAWFEAQGFDPGENVVVATPSFFEKLDEILKQTSLDTLKAWTKFQIVDSYAPFLPKKFASAHFKLHRQQLGGAKEQRPRWKRALTTMAPSRGFGALGELVGKIYVKRHFKPEAKEKMDALVQNLLTAFGDSIDGLEWMSEDTKAKARVKLSKITPKIGYTKEWRDYSAFVVEPDELIGNLKRSAKVEFDRNTNKLGQPIDKEEWGMTPQTVNAYYNPTRNEIVFPAAILQPPFFSVNAPEPLNYGGIGAVIGHEISHAFDDQGSQYDGDGNLENWWSDEDRKAFEKLTKRLISQFDGYEALPNQFVKGKFTLGENIADLSGLEISYKAMTKALKDKPPVEFASWNQDQLFFVGWSRVWARKYRDKEMLRRLSTDPHSPSEFRTNGPVSNIGAFYKAFGLKDGDELFKPEAERIRIW